jgi:hypothetical protein
MLLNIARRGRPTITRPCFAGPDGVMHRGFPALVSAKAARQLVELMAAQPDASLEELFAEFPLEHQRGCWFDDTALYGPPSRSSLR